MRRHRIIFLAAITCASGCHSSKRDIEAAKHSLYDTEFAVVYNAALEAVRKHYPNLEDAPGRGMIKTVWHQVTYGNHSDDLTNQQTLANAQGLVPQGSVTSSQRAAGMPTRLAYKRYFIRFDVSITGGRPWRLKVVGHASEWEPGAALPTELHGLARPSWLEGRTNSLLAAIHKRIKAYAVAMPDTPQEDEPRGSVRRSDPTAFKDVPPAAGKELATLKDALAGRNYAAVRGELADDVTWSLGGGTGADAAMATWQADPEPLDAMSKVLAAGCAGDAKRVTCPAGPPTSGVYQLVLEPRGNAWRVTSFVKAE